jgi:hypothetical protein
VKASKKTEGKSESTKNSEGITPSNALSIILHLKLFKKRNFIKSGFWESLPFKFHSEILTSK